MSAEKNRRELECPLEYRGGYDAVPVGRRAGVSRVLLLLAIIILLGAIGYGVATSFGLSADLSRAGEGAAAVLLETTRRS